MKTTLEILREARELISVPERWATGTLAREVLAAFDKAIEAEERK